MTYELYENGYIIGTKYVKYAIRKVSKNPGECRTYVVHTDGTTKTLKGLWDCTSGGGKFKRYLKSTEAEEMLFMEMI